MLSRFAVYRILPLRAAAKDLMYATSREKRQFGVHVPLHCRITTAATDLYVFGRPCFSYIFEALEDISRQEFRFINVIWTVFGH